MKPDQVILDSIRVASPCPANWKQMSGNDRVRFCDSCNLHVYNLSELARHEAAALISETEGRLCVKIYRRADGTVITRDCPVGLRAIRRRVARLATSVAVVVTTVGSNVFGYTGRRRIDLGIHRSAFELLDPTSMSDTAGICGRVTDPNGDPIQAATVTLTNSRTNQRFVAKTDKRGRYHFIVAHFGDYSLTVEATYFQKFYQDVELHLADHLRLDISMMVTGIVGIVVVEKVRGPGFDIDGVHVRVNEQ